MLLTTKEENVAMADLLLKTFCMEHYMLPCFILLISFLHLHSCNGYPSICWIGLQLVQEIWVLVQSILCAAAKGNYVILHVKDIFNYHSDCTICTYVSAKYHWICSLCNIKWYCHHVIYVHSCREQVHTCTRTHT